MANYFEQFLDSSGGGGPAPPPEEERRQPNYFEQFLDQPPPQPQQQQQIQAEPPKQNYFAQFLEKPQLNEAQWDRLEEKRGEEFRQTAPQPESMLGSFARRAAHAVLPSAAFYPGFAAATAATAPFLGPAAPAAGLVGGLITSAAAGAVQETGIKALGFDDSQQLAVNAAANPWSSTAGDIAGGAASFGIGKGAQLGARAIGALAGGGLEAGAQYVHEGEIDPTRVAGAAVGGGLLIKPRALTEAMGARAARAGEALRTKAVESWHGSGGSTAAAGTAQEHPPPSVRPDDLPQPPSGEAPSPPTASPPAGRPPAVETFEGGDPAVKMAVEGTPITPRVFEGEEVARPSGQVDTLLQGRGFSPEQIQALSPDEKTTILQRREGEAGAGPPTEPPAPITQQLEQEFPRPPVAPSERQMRPMVTEVEPPAAPAGRETIGDILKRQEATPTDPDLLRQRAARLREIGAEGMARQHELAADAVEQAQGGRRPGPEAPEAPPIAQQQQQEQPGRGVTAPAPKAVDPADQALIKDALAKRAAGAEQVGRADLTPDRPGLRRLTAIERAAQQAQGAVKPLEPAPKVQGENIRQAGEFRIEPNPEGGHFLMRGDQMVSQHANVGQAHIAMNRAAQGLAPGEGPAARAPAEKAGRKEGPLPAAAEPAGGPPPAGAAETPAGIRARAKAKAGRVAYDVEKLPDEQLKQLAQREDIPQNRKDLIAAELRARQLEQAPAAGPAAAGQPAARARGRPLRQQPTPAAEAAVPPAGAPPEAPPLGPPGAPPGQPPPRPPRQRLVPAGPDGDKEAFNAAQRADDDLHRLTTVPAADAQDFTRNLKQAGQQYPDIALTGGERIYKALERGTFDQLPVKLKQGYNMVAKPLIDEAVNIRNELVKRGEIDAEAFDPKYVHRIVKSQPTEIADPINEGRLPGMFDPSSTKELGVRGAEAKDGTRLVISSGEEKISIWNRGNQNFIDNPHGRALKTGDTFVHDGKTYTVDRGLSNEIERHATHEDGTPIQYHQNAFLSAFDYNRQMKMMKAYADWKDNFKDPQNSPFREYMTRNGEEANKRGWRQSEIPAFQGLYFHPHLEQVLHNNYNPGMGWRGSQGLNALRAINQFAVRSIFWNPVPHSMNALMHYAVSRGGDWLPMPKNDYGRNWVRSMQDAWDAVIRQGPLLQDLNRAGASLIMSKIDSQNMGENIGRVLGIDLRNNPGKWEKFARDWKLGTGADAVNAIYNGSQRLLWTFSDVLMAARIRELEMNNPGMSRPDAIAKARVHMPDYRVPIEFMGSHQMVRAMTDRNLSIFGRYHMGVFQSLGHMFGDLIGKNATLEQRKEAFGNVMALGVLGFIVKPILDGAVRLVTGNEEAETRSRGPLGPIKSGIEVAQGRQDPGMALSNIFTFSPAIRQIAQTIANRDFAGRRIVEPGSTLPQKALQYVEYTAGNVLSPYGTFGGTFQPGSSKGNILHELGTQLTDTRVPTQKQIQGKQYGELVTKREAETRARKPRGLLEYALGPGAPERQ